MRPLLNRMYVYQTNVRISINEYCNSNVWWEKSKIGFDGKFVPNYQARFYAISRLEHCNLFNMFDTAKEIQMSSMPCVVVRMNFIILLFSHSFFCQLFGRVLQKALYIMHAKLKC